MENKRLYYIILIILASVVLLGLLGCAGCVSRNTGDKNTEPTKNPTGNMEQIDMDSGEKNTLGTEDTLPDETAGEGTEATDATEGTEPTAESTAATTSPTTSTNPNSTKPDSTDPDSTEPTEPVLPNVYPYTLTWKEYQAMTEEEQIAFYKKFPSHSEYKLWYNAAKKKYDEEKIEIEIGADGVIDLDKITNGSN